MTLTGIMNCVLDSFTCLTGSLFILVWYLNEGFRIAQLVCRLATGWKGLNPGGGNIFRMRPDRPWGPLSLLYNGYRVPFPGVKWLGRGIAHPPPSSAEVKERVELYLYFPSRPSWPALG